MTGTKQTPVAVDYSFTIAKTNVLTEAAAKGVLSQDSDPAAGDSLVVDPTQTAALSVGGAKVLLNPDGSFQYDPRGVFPTLGQGQTYSDTFTYVIDDKFGSTAKATVHITVTGVEDPPVAPTIGVSAGLWTVGGQALTVSAANGLLSQAYSPDSGTSAGLTAYAVSGSSLTTTTRSKYGATVTVNPDGSFTYDPTTSASLQQLTASGQDVVDTFEYAVTDPHGTVIDPQVNIVVTGGPSPYRYDIVANTASGQYSQLGSGPSINNLGNVAFEGADAANQDDLYIWAPPSSGAATGTPPPAVSILGSRLRAIAPAWQQLVAAAPSSSSARTCRSTIPTTSSPSRVLGAQGLIGTLPAGLPAVTATQFLLSYAEIYFGGNALAGNATAAAYQIAVADGGLSAAGVQWGSPNFEDMEFAGILALLDSTAVGFAAGTAGFPDFLLLPRAYVTNPIWASALFPSPVDRLWSPLFWNESLVNPEAAIGGIGAFALGLALVPNALQYRLQDVDDFATIFPAVSLSDTQQQVTGSLPGFGSFFPGYTAYSAQSTSKDGGQNFLVTGNHIPAGRTVARRRPANRHRRDLAEGRR